MSTQNYDAEKTNPRHSLSNYYAKNDSLPSAISDEVFPQDSTVVSTLEDEDLNADRAVIANIFRDDRITQQQREHISKAILRENYEIFNNSGQTPNSASQKRNSMHRMEDTRRKMTLKRHRLPKPRFLTVNSESYQIPRICPKELRAKALDDIRANSPVKGGAAGTGNGLGASRGIISRSCTRLDQPEPNEYAKLFPIKLRDEKRRMLEESKGELSRLREESEHAKTAEKEAVAKRAQIKRRLAEFRQQLKDYLREINDPQAGNIMRCVDDSMVFHFMERYHGYTMSAEAILMLLGNSVGSSIVNPDPEEIDEGRKRELMKRSSVGILDNVSTTSSGASTLSSPGGQLMDQTRGNTRKRGDAYDRTRTKSILPNILASREPSRHAIRDGDRLPYSPRDFTPSSPPRARSAHGRTLGAGFRTGGGSGSPGSPTMFQQQSRVGEGRRRDPRRNNSLSHSLPVGHKMTDLPQRALDPPPFHEHLSIFGSDFMKEFDRMGVRAIAGGGLDEDSIDGKSMGEYSAETKLAIAAMRQQMIEEDNLPSLHPAKMLTEEQLLDIGLRRQPVSVILDDVIETAKAVASPEPVFSPTATSFKGFVPDPVPIPHSSSADLSARSNDFEDSIITQPSLSDYPQAVMEADKEADVSMFTDTLPTIPQESAAVEGIIAVEHREPAQQPPEQKEPGPSLIVVTPSVFLTESQADVSSVIDLDGSAPAVVGSGTDIHGNIADSKGDLLDDAKSIALHSSAPATLAGASSYEEERDIGGGAREGEEGEDVVSALGTPTSVRQHTPAVGGVASLSTRKSDASSQKVPMVKIGRGVMKTSTPARTVAVKSSEDSSSSARRPLLGRPRTPAQDETSAMQPPDPRAGPSAASSSGGVHGPSSATGTRTLNAVSGNFGAFRKGGGVGGGGIAALAPHQAARQQGLHISTSPALMEQPSYRTPPRSGFPPLGATFLAATSPKRSRAVETPDQGVAAHYQQLQQLQQRLQQEQRLKQHQQHQQHTQQGGAVKAPMAIKSQMKYESRDGLDFLPVSPFKTWTDRTMIASAGVPSGAGLALWNMPPSQRTRTGRYKSALRGAKRSEFVNSDQKHKYNNRPFISSS